MFGKFSEEAQKVMFLAKEEMSNLKHPYVGSEHLLLGILKQNNNLTKKLKKYNLTYKIFKEELIKIVGIGSSNSKWFLYTPLLKRVIENTIIESKENDTEITVDSLFLSLLEEGEGVAVRILIGLNIDINNLINEISVQKENKINNKKSVLKKLAINLNTISNNFDPVIGRKEEVNRVIEILSRRTKNNPILIGEPGVGKTAIVEELARLINNDEVPNALKNKSIYSLDLTSAIAGTKYRGEFEEKMKKLIDEVTTCNNIILFIDEIHNFVGAGGAEGAIDASNIFKPFLARGKIRIIGATTIDEYKKYIEKDGALERRFQKVFIEEPDKKKLKSILMNLRTTYEDYHDVIIKENIIDKIIELSSKYIYDRYEPDKSLDILDEVCASVKLKDMDLDKKIKKLSKDYELLNNKKKLYLKDNNYKKAYELKEREKEINSKIENIKLKNNYKKKKNVTEKDVIKIISNKTKIPVYELNNDYKKQLKIIKESLTKNVIGQEEAVEKLLNVAKKIKLGIKDSNKSYSLLFCGPTGVGKTYISKLFAEQLVGNKNIIKLDMGEYSDSASINKLIGSPAGYIGYNDNRNLFEKIRSKPYSVLILDEIEKCNRNILNLFLNILDEGKCTDSNGREIRFDNVLIIMTSNAIMSKKLMGFNNITENSLYEYFSKEFLNRIDEIVDFKAFNEYDIDKIINKELKKYNGKVKISINDIKKQSNYKEFGARKLKKLIKKQIENEIICNNS